ncbi:antitoxin [Desulfovibrio sp. ZJ369]|uniref:type II toxin-antitoxin system BrnA family antitoxin n=1 Tax=Desulfovibrio sp. ZJ369 TaxID=2709793 RepID=UPI0013EA5E26|nr:antitoxin [Desulfovibrio sp. ZJ369]
MKATEFDKHFDNGESVLPFADMSRAERPNLKSRRVNVDFPAWMVDALDKEAAHLGVTRQSLVKVWIANCLARDAHTTDHA